MKRFTLIVALVLLAAMPMFAEHVDPETARKVAATFFNNNGAKAAQLTDLSKAAGFPNLYIFTTEEGFVVMSADDCAKPILGYSLNNKFNVEDMPENMRSWLQQYSDEIQWGIENNIQPNTSTVTEWQDLKEEKTSKDEPTVVVAPLVSTSWDQNSPYNMYCPTGTVTGCVATAMAQVMKYWNYPETGKGEHSYTPENHPEYGVQSVDFEHTTYDWNNMTNTYGSSSTDTQKQAVATLMYSCGVSVDMEYGPSSEGGSGAVSSKVPDALVDYFNYAPSANYKSKDNYTNEQWIALLQAELDESRPIFYAGRYITSNGGGGHAFVCDGYRSDNYFHFNWGWGGYQNNQYWAIGALNPQSGGIGSGSGTYNLNNGAAFWVEPISSLTAPTISATIASGSITLSWDAVTGATSYDIYRDNAKITNITENSYTDSDVVSGFYYEYYVRAVAGSTRSNPSNRITKLAFYRDYTPTNLTATLTNSNATLAWIEPQNNDATLQYATAYAGRVGMGAEKDTYWAEVFDPSRLTGFEGMYINKVSTYLYFTGNYKLFIYEGDPAEESSNKLIEKDITNTTAQAWKDIEIESPTVFDYTKELWVILYFPGTDNNSGNSPAPCGLYDDIPFEDETNPERFNPRLIGESLTEWNYIGGNYSWLIRTYITDGTYTYNIYDNGIKLNGETPISDTSYTIENIENNTIHNYTVKTNYYGGESEASNTASLALGANTLEDLTLENDDNMTIGSSSTLTVNGTLSNTNPDNLVIEDGAQLIHNSDGVAATVKKDIAAWTTETNVGGWYFIASPINSTELAPNSVDNMLTDANEENGPRTYDFYRLENDNWKNYRKNAFNLTNGEGYLYANESAQTMSFKGEIKPYDAENNSVTLSAGWNLIGNPYTRNVVPNMAYHTLNNGASTTSVMANEGLVAPGMGIAVYSENGGTLSFNLPSESSSAPSNGNLQITLNQQITNRNNTNTIAIDNTIVSFNECEGLPKFPLLEANSKLYIPKGNEEYAIVSSAAQSEMPINFKANENGIYTLTVNPENVKMNYLHLIDNLTGNNIDLLISPDYTFEAKTTDYATRFRLMFASVCEDTDDDNENFVFINDGNIIVYKEGTLQVVDMTGRVVYQGDAINRVSTSRMTLGVYVLRLITTNGVKTQKIVID
jgi:hypothetical protein